MEFIFGSTIEVPVSTQNNLGEGADADAEPSYRVYEVGIATAVLTGSCVKKDEAMLGAYVAPVPTVSLEVGHWYEVFVQATVDGVISADVCMMMFTLRAALVPTAEENAAAVVAAAFGDGTANCSFTVEDDDGAAVPDARLTVGPFVVQASDGTGAFPFAWGLDPEATYEASLQVTGGYVAPNPITVTTDQNGDLVEPAGGVIVVEKIALPEPAAAGYCVVRCLAERYTDTEATGTFEFVSGLLPETRDSGDVTVTLVDGAESVTLVDGVATMNILQGATVTLRLNTPGQVVEKRNRIIPDSLYADWEDLLTAE